MADDSWLVLRNTLKSGAPDGKTPDIILGGAQPDPAYAKNYDKVFNQVGNFGGDNYVYVRTKNASEDVAFGDLTVYVAYLADLSSQGKWTTLRTSDGRPSTNIGAAAGKAQTNGAPLIWTSNGLPAKDAAYCLIAEISNDEFPPLKLPPSVKDKASFDAWVAKQSRLTYLIVKAPDVVVVPAPAFTWHGYVNVANSDPTQLTAALTCTNAPAGGTCSFVFAEKDANGAAIGLGDTAIKVNAGFTQSATVPASYTSKVTVTYKPGTGNDARADFTFQVNTVTSGGGDDDDIGQTHAIVVAHYTLSFSQAHLPDPT